MLDRNGILTTVVVAASAFLAAVSAHAGPPERAALAEIARHDVVWTSPGLDAAGSMPIGNGTMGANLWVEADGDLVLLLSHVDAFSEADRLLKLGRVRIECDPPLSVDPFVQRHALADGAVVVESGAGEARASVRVFVDAGSDVVYACIESPRPRALRVALESWRTSERRFGAGGDGGDSIEMAGSWTMRGAPASVEVRESADVIVSMEEEPDAVAWYHRNEWSVVTETLALQGLAEHAGAFGDPLIVRTFGGRIDGDGLARVSPTEMRSVGTSTSATVRITCACSQADDASGWLRRLRAAAALAPACGDSSTRTADAWRDRWTRSWIHVDEPPASTLANAPPLRIGVDSNGTNRFDGTIRDARLTEDPSGSWSFDALVEPGRAGVTGRIGDRITAGGSDGFLLDLQGGRLRAVLGTSVLQTMGQPMPGKPSRVTAAFDATSGMLRVMLDGTEVGAAEIRLRPRLSQALAVQRAMTLAATGGRFPIKFNGSIFTVAPRHVVDGGSADDDARRWGGSFWWQNTRLPYHGMLARGDGDRMASLFGFYARAVAGARARTRAYHGVDGAYFPETMTTFGSYANGDYGWDRTGLAPSDVQCPWWQYAWNQGPELVALMLDHFDHVGDVERLRAETLPVARAVLGYFDARFGRGADGRLVISPTQALETYWSGVVNDLPTVVGLHEVIARLRALPVDVVEPRDRALWARLAVALPPVPRTDDGRRFAPAERFDPVRSNCENPELVAVWPFRLAEADLEIGRATFAARPERHQAGWPQDGMQAARLGLADEAAADVLARLSNVHPRFRYPGFWGPNFDWVPDQCHGANLLTTVGEMLLQAGPGADGPIAVLPAWPKDWNVRFRLHAPRGVVVTGEVRDRALAWLDVDPPEARARVRVGGGWTIPKDARR